MLSNTNSNTSSYNSNDPSFFFAFLLLFLLLLLLPSSSRGWCVILWLPGATTGVEDVCVSAGHEVTEHTNVAFKTSVLGFHNCCTKQSHESGERSTESILNDFCPAISPEIIPRLTISDFREHRTIYHHRPRAKSSSGSPSLR